MIEEKTEYWEEFDSNDDDLFEDDEYLDDYDEDDNVDYIDDDEY